MDERVIEEARSKVKNTEEIKHEFACIETVAFASKVNVTMFIPMKTVLIICRRKNAGIANVETYRDKQGLIRTHKDRRGQTGTERDKHGQTRTSRDRQGQTWTSRDRQGQTGIDRDRQGQEGTARDRQGQEGTIQQGKTGTNRAGTELG